LREARPAGKKAIAPRKDSRSAEAADKPAKRHKWVAAPGDRLERRPAIRAACEGWLQFDRDGAL